MLVDDIAAKGHEKLRELISEAYQAGYSAGLLQGERDAAAKLQSKLMELFEGGVGSPSTKENSLLTFPEDSDAKPGSEERVAPGTVKPAILSLLRGSQRGLSVRQIEDATGFKHNSVRGTIWTLQKEGQVFRGEGGRWHAKPDPDDKTLTAEQVHREFLSGTKYEPSDTSASNGSKPGSDGDSPSPENHINPAPAERQHGGFHG